MGKIDFIPEPINNHAGWQIEIGGYKINIGTTFVYWIKKRKGYNERIYIIAKEVYCVNGYKNLAMKHFDSDGLKNDSHLFEKRKEVITALIKSVKSCPLNLI